jgi:hypothetical protein
MQWEPFVQGGAVVVLIVFVYAILRGKLVPSTQVEAQLRQKDEVIQLWKGAAELREQALQETVPLIKEGLENDKTVIRMVAAMRDVVDALSRGKSDAVDPT